MKRTRRPCRSCQRARAERGADLCLVCALIADAIVSLCSMRQRRWGELRACVVMHCRWHVGERELSAARIRAALGDVLGRGVLERLPGGYYLTTLARPARARAA